MAVVVHPAHGFPAAIEPLERRILFTRFAIAGDFAETTSFDGVAALMEGWNPDHIITAGDNNNNDDDDLEGTIGVKFHEWISPYLGTKGPGSTTGNRLWPVLGNHDWDGGLSNYTSYFTLPHNERYYSIQLGEVEWFMIDSDQREPDGTSAASTQGVWLQNALAASATPWQIVVMHHPPYSSASVPDNTWMRWPFKEWGADVIMSGHDHLYERLNVNGLAAFIVGTGGAGLHSFGTTDPNSQFRYDSSSGAMRLEASNTSLQFQFYNRHGTLIDSHTLNASVPTAPVAPSNLSAAVVGSGQINLAWNDNSSNETGFKIERSINGGMFSELATLAANTVTFSNTNLSPTTNYAYRVRAYNGVGPSGYSSTINKTTLNTMLPLPWLDRDIGVVGAAGSASHSGGVFALSASGADVWSSADSFNFLHRPWTGNGQIVARVLTPSGPADAFAGIMFRESLSADSKHASVLIDSDLVGLVRRTSTGGSSSSSNASTTTPRWLKLIRSGDNFTAYHSSSGASWTQLGSAVSVPMTSTIYVGLLGCSTVPGTLATLSLDNVQVSTSTNVVLTPPLPPSALVASVISNSQINLTWADNSSNESGFKIERRIGTLGTWSQIATVGAGVTNFSNINLAAGTQYQYRVRAYNGDGDSTYSNFAWGTTDPGSIVPLIVKSSQWKYLDNGTNQGSTWRGIGFNDSTWASGAAKLGYGEGDEATVVSFGPSPGNRHITTYFRKSFNIADPSQVAALTLGLLRDDGAVVYLNDSEVLRSNMPEGAISYTTRAASDVSGADESTYFPASILPALLVSGTNVLAVELHQRARNSSDLAFDLELKATLSNPVAKPSAPSALAAVAISPTQIKLQWLDTATNESGFKIERSADGINFVEIATVGAGATSYTDGGRTSGATYWYRVRAYNIAGESAYSGPVSATTPIAEESQLLLGETSTLGQRRLRDFAFHPRKA